MDASTRGRAPASNDGHDRGAGPAERAQEWALRKWPVSQRKRVIASFAIVVIAIGTLTASVRVLRGLIGGIEVDIESIAASLGGLAYISMMIACWIGAGGALVPIPGVRALSWLMVIHQGAALDPVLVATLAAISMSLGQTSYFLAARTGARHLDRRADPRDDEPAAARDPAVDAAGGMPDMALPDQARAEPGARHASAAGARARAMRARDRVERLVRAHPKRTVFLLSLFPNPMTTVATATAGAAGIPYPTFIAASLSGFLVWTTLLAFAGQGILYTFQTLFG